MRQIFFFLVTAVMINVLSGCGSAKKIEALKPAPSYNSNIVYDKQTSYLNLPVEVAVSDLQAQTNKYLNGLIYDDEQIEGDNLMMKVWKQAPITITEKSGKLEIVLPLKIWAKLRYGIEKFGLSAYDTREFNLNGSVRLSSRVAFSNWKRRRACSRHLELLLDTSIKGARKPSNFPNSTNHWDTKPFVGAATTI